VIGQARSVAERKGGSDEKKTVFTTFGAVKGGEGGAYNWA